MAIHYAKSLSLQMLEQGKCYISYLSARCSKLIRTRFNLRERVTIIYRILMYSELLEHILAEDGFL